MYCRNCGKDISHRPKNAIYCEECSKSLDHAKALLRSARFRRRHRKDIRLKNRQWNQAHPKRRREIARKYCRVHSTECYEKVRKWREQNPEKYALQRRRAWKRGLFRSWYLRNIEATVAVTCGICGIFFPVKRAGRILCGGCKSKWDRKLPRRVKHEMDCFPSFSVMPAELKIWKDIIELRRQHIRFK